jgi:hypothetical protein
VRFFLEDIHVSYTHPVIHRGVYGTVVKNLSHPRFNKIKTSKCVKVYFFPDIVWRKKIEEMAGS